MQQNTKLQMIFTNHIQIEKQDLCDTNENLRNSGLFDFSSIWKNISGSEVIKHL